ncbi:sororin [Anoplopoma fimbria]|uniref:sororin n=1 Tax=Anoplopoma fimbria TaxID=229290 RepID=UPI0023ED1C16|nr:sororin [Anoplopoma fimbria]
MNEGALQNIMAGSHNLNSSQRRRSPRLSSPPQANLKTDNKMALTSAAVKRSITVRKIAPRKTVAPSEHNKENTPRRSASESSTQKNPQVSTPALLPGRGGSSSAKKKKKKAAVLSPILPSTPPAPSHPKQPAADPEDAVWSQKVRRSYSRLSEQSFSSPDSRHNLFGFDKMKTPEVAPRGQRSKTGLEVSCGSLTGLNSFTSLLEADDCGSVSLEPDTNIPGVTLVKEKRMRRKKVQQIGTTELDALAAEMNAEFEEAEEFELLVE